MSADAADPREGPGAMTARTRHVAAPAARGPRLEQARDGPPAHPGRPRRRRQLPARHRQHVPQHPPLGTRPARVLLSATSSTTARPSASRPPSSVPRRPAPTQDPRTGCLPRPRRSQPCRRRRTARTCFLRHASPGRPSPASTPRRRLPWKTRARFRALHGRARGVDGSARGKRPRRAGRAARHRRGHLRATPRRRGAAGSPD